MRRAVLPWLVGAAILLLGSVGLVLVADATVFSASSFVRVYLDALTRRDATAAASVPGVSTGSLSRDAIATAALPPLSDVREVSDRALADGRHRIRIAWTSRGSSGTSTFVVEPSGTRLLPFPAWRFATPPVARLDVEPVGDTRYRIERQDAVAGRDVALLVPGAYRVDMHGPIAESSPVDVVATRPGSRLAAAPAGTATDAFDAAVDRAIRDALDSCAEQTALYPAGCPFGAEVTDRIASEPVWRISQYPDATLEPTATPGVWTAELGGGVAAVEVDVRSLFDGSVTTRTIDAPIDGTYRIVVDDDRPVVAGLGPDDG